MKRLFTLGWVTLTMVGVSTAQDTGTVTVAGYTFTIPEGWKGQATEDSYVMGSDTEPGMIIMVPNSASSQDELEGAIRDNLTDHYSYRFNLTSEITRKPDGLLFTGFEGNLGSDQVTGFLAGMVSENAGGLLILGMTTPELYSDRYRDLCLGIAASLKFPAPAADRTAATAGAADALVSRYTGVKLTYMSSYYSSSYTEGGISGGYSDNVEISLCESGSFTFRDRSEMTAGGDNSSMWYDRKDRGDGTWVIRPQGSNRGTLVLSFLDGREKQFLLEVNEKGETYLDGYRYYRTTGADGPEYAPVCY